MTSHEHARYDLQDGYIHTWLIVGPQRVSTGDTTNLTTPSHRLEALTAHAGSAGTSLDFTMAPMEPAEPSQGEVTTGEYTDRWRMFHCLEDHFVDLSDATERGHLRAWAYAGLESAGVQQVKLVLTTTDLADVWLNGVHVYRQLRTEPGTRPVTGSFEITLNEGNNDLVVRFETVTPSPAPFVLALRVAAEQAPTVTLPTLISPLTRRQRLETVFQAAYMKQYVFTRYETVQLFWPDKDAPVLSSVDPTSIAVRIQTPAGRVYAEADRVGDAGKIAEMGSTYKYPNGPLNALLMPRGREYYEGNMRVARIISFWGLDNEPYIATPTHTFPERRQAALLSAARREANIYSEIAKMAIGWWSRLELPLTLETARQVQEEGSAVDYADLLALVGMLERFGSDDAFPAELHQPIEDATLNAVYLQEEASIHEHPESWELLSAACEILAGQRFPETAFRASGQPGAWHRLQGEARALRWMHARATQGFDAWHSDIAYAETILALAHLIDFAESDPVWEMASVLLDKLFFLIGANSFKGIFGSSRGKTTPSAILGGVLETTSAIARLMWGTGVYNMHMAAPVSLALLENYEMPVLLQAIAADQPEQLWSRERHGLTTSANTVTYKTPDFMLSSVQDYRPGEPGADEHVWQATLGPGATVFTTHPVCAGLNDAQRPNFWRGNGVLPRVVQWQDALIALYDLPENDWMSFTHAYFPVHSFEEHVLREGWAFARQGEGYLALTAWGGLTQPHTGPTAERELRSPGKQNAWLCQMGRAALDGDFAAFQAKVLALPVTYNGTPGVRWTTLRGDELALDWTGPFMKNGESVPVTFKPHIDNTYCTADLPAEVLDIQYSGTVMRLKFEKP